MNNKTLPKTYEVPDLLIRSPGDHEDLRKQNILPNDDADIDDDYDNYNAANDGREQYHKHDQHWFLEFKDKDTEARYVHFRYSPPGLYFPLGAFLVFGAVHFSVTQMYFHADVFRDSFADWMFSSKSSWQTEETRDVRIHYILSAVICVCVVAISMLLRFTLWKTTPIPAWFLELLWVAGNFIQGSPHITMQFRYQEFCRPGQISILQRDPCNEIMTTCDDFYEPYIVLAAVGAVVLPIRLRYLPLWYVMLLSPLVFTKLYFKYDHFFRTSDALWIPSMFLFFTIFLASIETVFRHQFIQREIFEQEVRETQNAQEAVKKLLVAMLPKSVLKRIMANETIHDSGTISSVFSDVVEFTSWCSAHRAKVVVAMLNTMYIQFDSGLKRYGVEKVKTIGDAYWAICGLPDANDDHALHICAFAKYMLRSVERMREDDPLHENIRVRLGVATGKVCGGLVGSHQSTYDVFGTTTEVAEIMEQNAPVDGILLSEATYNELKDVHRMIADDDGGSDQHADGGFLATSARVERRSEPVSTPLGPMTTYVLHSFNWMPPTQHKEGISGVKSTPKEAQATSSHDDVEAQVVEIVRSRRSSLISANDDCQEPAQHQPESDEIDKDVQALQAELSKASHCLHHTFDNEEVEAEFQTFMASQFSRKFLVVSVLLGTLVFNIFIVMLAEGRSHPWHTYVLLTLLTLTIVAQVFVSKRMDVPPLAGLAAFYAECNVLLIALVFANRSVATMDLLYLPFNFTVMSPTLGYIGAKLPYLYMCVLNITFLFVPSLIAQIFTKTMYLHHFIAPGMFMCIWIIALRRSEMGQRQQFMDEKLAEVALTQTRSEHEKVSELLSRMVPRFIVDELTVWFCGPRETMIAANFRLIGIMFARVPSLRLQLSDKSSNPGDVMSAISQYASLCDGVLDGFPGCTKLKIIGDILMFASGLDQHSSSAANDGCLSNPTDSLTMSSFPSLQTDQRRHHNGTDLQDVLSNHSAETYQTTELKSEASSAEDGMSVLSHSHQDPSSSHHLAALAQLALALSEKVESELQGAVLSAGMHCGSASAGIIGTDRLIYDVFGDTVNTASRVMSTSGEGVWASVKFSTKVATSNQKQGLFFGAHEERVMKGKGSMHVVSVARLPEG